METKTLFKPCTKYSHPCQVMKCTFASPASDMWSLGVGTVFLTTRYWNYSNTILPQLAHPGCPDDARLWWDQPLLGWHRYCHSTKSGRWLLTICVELFCHNLSWDYVTCFSSKKSEDSSSQSRAQFSLDDPAFEVVSNNSKELIKKWEFHIITIFIRMPLNSQVVGADSNEKTDSQGGPGSPMACLWPQNSSAWQVESLELFWNWN